MLWLVEQSFDVEGSEASQFLCKSFPIPPEQSMQVVSASGLAFADGGD